MLYSSPKLMELLVKDEGLCLWTVSAHVGGMCGQKTDGHMQSVRTRMEARWGRMCWLQETTCIHKELRALPRVSLLLKETTGPPDPSVNFACQLPPCFQPGCPPESYPEEA